MAGIRADRRLWLTADRQRVVEDGDEEAAFLLAAPGHIIPDREIARLGLEARDGKVRYKAKRPAEDKAFKGPSEDKATRGPRAAKADASSESADASEDKEGAPSEGDAPEDKAG